MPETESTTPETQPEPTPEETPADDGLGDAGKKALDGERAARRAAEKQSKEAQKAIADLQNQVKSFEDRDKTEAQKAADRIAELEKALADKDSVIAFKDLEAERSKIASEKGVPASLVTGVTREEMEAKPISALRSGASTSVTSDPKDRAAAALRSSWQNR
jgi:predicted  nucleic acid-binding Zn-ribbon protein